MRNAHTVVVLLLVLSASGVAQTTPLEVTPEQVQRVEILYFPERILVRAALSPERLEQGCRYKLEIRDANQSTEWKRLLPLLRQISVESKARSYDHRTAVLFYDKDGKRIASVYFDGFGQGGTINGKSGQISGGLYGWAKSLLKGIDN
jgi:hypothetical protein